MVGDAFVHVKLQVYVNCTARLSAKTICQIVCKRFDSEDVFCSGKLIRRTGCCYVLTQAVGFSFFFFFSFFLFFVGGLSTFTLIEF